jgi:CheY-like chemotaxis protein
MTQSIDPAQYKIPSNLRVLIAEDTEVSRKVLVLVFKKMGIEPEWVEDGEQAVEKALASNFDLIMMDIWMPVMNGMQATRYIRSEMKGNQPIIIGVGGDGSDDDVRASLDAGMDAYVVKPPKVQNLLVLIGNLLSQRKPA